MDLSHQELARMKAAQLVREASVRYAPKPAPVVVERRRSRLRLPRLVLRPQPC